MITDREVEHYREKGWVVVADVLDASMLAETRETLAALVEGARGKTAHDDVHDLEPDHQPDAPRVRRIKTPHKHHPLFWNIAASERMVAILQKLIAPSVRLHGSKINMKAPHYGSPVEWHQDWAFYPHTNDDLLAVGVMLDGTHRGPVYDHHCDGYFCGAMDPTAAGLDFSKAVPVTGRAGSMSFHHVRTVHGSAQNMSGKPRALLLYEFAAADAWPLAGIKDLAEFDSRLVCGQPTIEPRLADVPVRMPLPPAPRQGSIYENQTTAKNRYFGRQAA